MYRTTIVLDAGSSVTKILYGWIDKNEKYVVKYMMMGSECISLSRDSGDYLCDGMGMGLPEDNAWVRYEQDGEIVAIGRFARQYGATPTINPLKGTMIVSKILAAIGAIAEREGITEEIELDLGLLLPLNEITSKKQVLSDLTQAIKEFYFRDKQIKIKLDRCRIVPEATGLALLSKALDEKGFRRTEQGFLMLGHRNTSFLLFERGSFALTKSSSTVHGFYNLIDKFRQKVPGIEREQVLKIIETKGSVKYDWQKDIYLLENCTTGVNFASLKDKQRDVDMLKKAYQASLDEYTRRIALWLQDCDLSDLDVLWCCGGAAPFIFGKIRELYPNLNLFRPINESSKLWKALGYDRCDYPPELIQQNLIERTIDAWGFFVVFSDYYLRQEVFT